jgi:hypothetical protein
MRTLRDLVWALWAVLLTLFTLGIFMWRAQLESTQGCRR